MFELTKSDIVLIHVISDFRELFPVRGVLIPNFCDMFNVPDNDASTTELLKTSINHLLKRKIIYCKYKNKLLTYLNDDDFTVAEIYIGLTKHGGKVWELVFEVNWENCWINKSFDYNSENDFIILIDIFFNMNHLKKFKKFIKDKTYLELIELNEDEKNTFPIWDKPKAKKACLCGLKIFTFDKYEELDKKMPRLYWKRNINDVLSQWQPFDKTV